MVTRILSWLHKQGLTPCEWVTEKNDLGVFWKKCGIVGCGRIRHFYLWEMRRDPDAWRPVEDPPPVREEKI